MPLVTVHAAMMHTGQLLFFDAWEIPGTPSARLWDPATNVYTPVPNGFAELFCAGHILTADGRLLTVGGHNGAGVGTTDVTYFDPSTLQWTPRPDLNYARWYPSVTPLADGRTVTLGGAISRPNIAEVPEILAASGSSWSTVPGAQKDVGEYPQLYQVADGRLFVSGADFSFQSWLLDVGTSNWTPLGQGPAGGGTGVMYRPGKVLMAGGGTQGVDPVTQAAAVIDLNAANPTWRQVGSMAYGRAQHNLVLLPDGTVLVVGGADEVSLISTSGVRPAEIWDPDTETWTTVASMARNRMYHSIAILLADGRVLSSGGGRINPAVTDETNGQFYSPPYLFKGTRPVVSSTPASVNYGATFTVGLPNPGAADRVTFVRASSVTHGINLDQRFFELSFSAGAGTLTVTAPNDARLAPAGDYHLFVLDAAGVPSVGRLIRLGGAPTAPSLSIGDVSVNEGTAAGNNAVFTVTLSGSPAQTVTVNYATASGTASPGVDFSSRSGSLSFTPGTTSRTIVVPTIPDTLIEGNETFTLTLAGATNATIGRATATGTIVDDDAPASSSLSVNSVTVPEGSSGLPVAAFTVTLSPASAQNVVVSYRTLPGSATSPTDFTSTTGTLTFAGGTTTQTVQVPIVPDLVVEENETFSLELYNPVNAVFGSPVGTATILDDDSGTVTATYAITLGENDVNEDGGSLAADGGQVWLGTGASAAGSYLGLRFTGVTIPAGATVTAARVEVDAAVSQWTSMAFEMAVEASPNSAPFGPSAPPSQRVLLAPRVSHASNAPWVAGTRYALEDVTALVQAAVQQPGWAGQALTLVLRGTGSAWGRKHVAAAESGSATAPRLVVTYSTGGATPNQPPVITAASGVPTSGVAPLVVNFAGAATDPEGAPLTYTWLFGDGTQASGAAVSHSYTPGTYSATLQVSDGTTTVASAPVNVQASSPTVPGLSVADASVTEGHTGTVLATFVVTRTIGGSTTSVNYATSNGSAAAPGDYVATSGSITMTGPTLTATITVPVVGDSTVEPDETFTLTLSSPVGATITDGSAVGTIVNDDGVAGPVTVTHVVAAGGDDVNEEGASFSPDGALWVGNGSSAAASYLGLRFTGVSIPAGATVTAARLELTAAATQWNSVAFEIAAEAAGHSAAFSAASRPSQRTLLVPRVVHASDAQWIAGTRYALDDITSVVQAAVSQPAWASGQALSVIIRGTGGAWARKFISSVEGGAAVAPRLVVTYTGGGGSPVNLPPVITAATGSPTSDTAPLTVAFSGAATDPEGAPLTYAWAFGTGATAAGANVNYTYTAAGSYSATLSVSDGTHTVTSAPIAITVGSVVQPTLSVNDATVTEGNSGPTTATFTVTLSPASASTVTVGYATANGTAVAPGDYTAASGTLSFSPGATSRTFTVTVAGDTTVEPTETFTVTLSNPGNATIADGSGTGTIVNDDAAGGGPVTATYVVATGADDVNEDGGGFTTEGWWIGNGASSTASYLGLRFTGVTIPAGATVTSARLEVLAGATQWTTLGLELGAEASGNSAPFSTASRPSGRTLLAPRVQHSSNAPWTLGTRYLLDEMAPVIQAVVNQPGWAAGQALSVIARGTAGAWARKWIESAEGGPNDAVRLVVSYTVP
ncbi:MAG: Calx-beta domain-containing protein [Vicinamibacterales bacterium]